VSHAEYSYRGGEETAGGVSLEMQPAVCAAFRALKFLIPHLAFKFLIPRSALKVHEPYISHEIDGSSFLSAIKN
jgi:hypothetical protein